MADFSELKNVKLKDVEKPKALPVGHYEAIFAGPAQPHESSQKKTLALRFPVKLVRPLDDVDLEALEAAGGIKEDKTYNVDFWMSPDARYRFTEFGLAMGHSDDLSITDLAEALVSSGTTFQVEGTHQPNQRDPETPFFRLDNLAPMPE